MKGVLKDFDNFFTGFLRLKYLIKEIISFLQGEKGFWSQNLEIPLYNNLDIIYATFKFNIEGKNVLKKHNQWNCI